MIIWLASYPKSGNTWIRGFITSLIYTNDGLSNLKNFKRIAQYPLKSHFLNLIDNFNDINKIKKYYHTTQDTINLDNKVKFLKTHNAMINIQGDNFSNTKNTLGVIHIVRDPRNIITSLKNHFFLKSYEEAREFLFDDKRIIRGDFGQPDFPIATLIASWNIHYYSWKQVQKNYLLIRYEDLIKNPFEEFYKISNYLSNLLGEKFSKNKIENSIQSNSFDRLKQQEKIEGFGEFVNNKNKSFFHLGPENNWKILLNKDLAKEIELKFKNEMKELNYI